jgi:hypothetical protein
LLSPCRFITQLRQDLRGPIIASIFIRQQHRLHILILIILLFGIRLEPRRIHIGINNVLEPLILIPLQELEQPSPLPHLKLLIGQRHILHPHIQEALGLGAEIAGNLHWALFGKAGQSKEVVADADVGDDRAEGFVGKMHLAAFARAHEVVALPQEVLAVTVQMVWLVDQEQSLWFHTEQF